MLSKRSLGLLCAIALACGAAGPTTAPSNLDDPSVMSKTRLQDFPAISYFHATTTTTLKDLSKTTKETMIRLRAALKEAGADAKGAPLIVMKGVTNDPTQPSELQIGVPTTEDAREVDDFKVTKLEAFHCASILFSGPATEIHGAFEQVFSDALQSGEVPTGEIREMICYWEGEESANNIMSIQIGVR